MEITTETITPEQAERFLVRNKSNRPISKTLVTNYSKAISRGEWELNGDAIRIAKDGELLDGQHRLLAIVKSGCSIKTLLVTGLDQIVFDTIDRGKSRTVADILAINGEVNYGALASVLMMVYTYGRTGRPTGITNENKPTVRQLEKLLAEEPDIRKSVSFAISRRWFKEYASVAVTAFCHYIFKQDGIGLADTFFYELAEGVGLPKGSPLIPLRDRFVANKGAREKMRTAYKIALIFKAYKKYRDEVFTKHLRVETGEGQVTIPTVAFDLSR